MKHSIRILALVALLALPTLAQANSPRDYLPLDPGSFFFALYYDHYFGNDLYSKGDKVSSAAQYYANVSVFRGVYYTNLGPFTIDPQIIFPFGEANLTGHDSAGIGDATFASTIWFVNNKENRFIFAYTPFLTAPTGRYDRDSVVNLGSNRWSTKHELCIAKGLGDSAWLEISAYMQFYFDNTNALGSNNNRVTATKDPNVGAEAHLSYDFTKQFFGSFDYYYLYGGENRIDGVRQKDWADTHTLGVTFAYMLNPHTQIMVNGKTDAGVFNGIMTHSFGARLGFIF